MADNEKEQAPPPASPLKKLLPLVAVAAVIGGLAAFGGFMTGQMLVTHQARASAVEPPKQETHKAEGEELFYYRLDGIMANLSDARMARYVRTTPTLAIRPGDKDAAVALLEKRKPEIKGWLVVYLSGCTIENVRGPDNLKRIQREIMDGLNDKLWPDQKPLIVDVILEDIAVQ